MSSQITQLLIQSGALGLLALLIWRLDKILSKFVDRMNDAAVKTNDRLTANEIKSAERHAEIVQRFAESIASNEIAAERRYHDAESASDRRVRDAEHGMQEIKDDILSSAKDNRHDLRSVLMSSGLVAQNQARKEQPK